MSNTRRHAAGVASLLFLLTGCTAASGQDRPDDGVLTDTSLQAVVDAQTRRDADALIAYLGYEDAAVRARAAFGLASVQDMSARSALFDLLDDPTPTVRADAAFAIGQLPDTTGTRVLVERLRQETDGRVRAELIRAVGKAGGREAAGLLFRTEVRDEHLADLAAAVARLGTRGVNNAVGVEKLIELLGHEDPIVRRNSAFYFGASARPSFWTPVAPRLRERLAALDRNDQAATWLLRALTLLRDPSDTPTGLTWLAEGVDWRTRYAAAELLRDRVSEGAVTLAFSAALGDASPHVRASAARGLASRGRPLTAEDRLFIDTWIDQHVDDIQTIKALLPIRMADDPLQVLEWGDQFDEQSPQRAAALEELGVLPGLAVVEREIIAAAGDGPTARVALGALELRIGPASNENLTRILEVATQAVASGDPSKVQLAAILLVHPRMVAAGSVAVLGSAIEASADRPELLLALYRAVAASGAEEALAILERALDSDNADIQTIAAEGIESLTGSTPEYSPVERAIPQVDWAHLAELGRFPRVTLETPRGDVVVELDSEQAPLTASTLLGLVTDGLLVDVPFHRVVAGFVVQGGDVTNRDGFGAPPQTIRSEFTRMRFDRGVLGMASSGKDTEGAQFFITHLPTPQLDGGFTALGRVVAGQGVVDALVQGDLLLAARVAPSER